MRFLSQNSTEETSVHNQTPPVATAINKFEKALAAVDGCSEGNAKSWGYAVQDFDDHETEHWVLHFERAVLIRFARRLLVGRQSLLIDRFYVLRPAPFYVQVYYGWKSRAFDQAVALALFIEVSRDALGACRTKIIVHRRRRFDRTCQWRLVDVDSTQPI